MTQVTKKIKNMAAADTDVDFDCCQTWQSRESPNVVLRKIGSGPRERWQVEWWEEIGGEAVFFKSQTARSLDLAIKFYSYQLAKCKNGNK